MFFKYLFCCRLVVPQSVLQLNGAGQYCVQANSLKYFLVPLDVGFIFFLHSYFNL